jgi:D-glycero-D-manno-heptose 1,7-bisphosphate phosphatase
MAPTTVFLDRDGTINRGAPPGDYIKDWSEFEFLPRAPEAIARLNTAGLRVVVVTNQRGVALGRMSADAVEDIHRRMTLELGAAGADLAGIYWCPHDAGQCMCRKPDVGMFEQARREMPGIEFASSVVIGDSSADMEAAARIGARRILIAADDQPEPADANEQVASLWEAAALVDEPVRP